MMKKEEHCKGGRLWKQKEEQIEDTNQEDRRTQEVRRRREGGKEGGRDAPTI